jgi:fatty acid desaturase
MAITEVPEYAHLSDTDLEELAAALETIRCDIEASRGTKDRAYIKRVIAFHRCLEIAARLAIGMSKGKFGWAVGTGALAAAKSIENMELGHNISHGQWDWMNDPEIHSNSWEWDTAGLTSQWRHSHNYRHHVFANIVDIDDDLGFRIIRVTRDQEWQPGTLLQPLYAVLLAVAFEWGVALHGLISIQEGETTDAAKSAHKTALLRKMARQAGKDYVLFPALSRRRWWRTLAANVVANGLRNVWAYIVIVCGHFVDGAEKFTKSNITSFLTCRVIATPRSQRGCALCASPTTCPTRPVRCYASICSPCAQSANWRFRTGFFSPPPTTHQRQRPSTDSGISRNDRTYQAPGTMCGDAVWRQQYSPAAIDASSQTVRPSRYKASGTTLKAGCR